MGLLAAGLGTVFNLVGAFNAAQQRRRAEAYRRQQLMELSRLNDEYINALRSGNLQNLRIVTAQLNDMLRSQGAALGEAMARGGVYNSTAVAGALERRAAENAGILARAQADAIQAETEARARANAEIMRSSLSDLGEDLRFARQGEQGAMLGLGSALSNLVEAISPRRVGPYVIGTQGNKPPSPLMKSGGGGPLSPDFPRLSSFQTSTTPSSVFSLSPGLRDIMNWSPDYSRRMAGVGDFEIPAPITRLTPDGVYRVKRWY